MESADVGEWQGNWELFTESLERHLQAGTTSDELSRLVSGKTIQWRGTIESLDIDDIAPNVDVALQGRSIEIGNGKKALSNGVSAPVADSAASAWRSLSVGAEVVFGASFEDGNSPFPPLEIKTLNSGRSVVMLRLSDAVPVS